MRRIALIDRAERRRLEKIAQRSKDKRFSRRANAILLIYSWQSRKRVAVLLSAARSSVNRWCQQCKRVAKYTCFLNQIVIKFSHYFD